MTLIRTDNEKVLTLERLLNDAREEADALRRRVERSEQLINSTRLIMGHELKKPTTAICGYLELIQQALEDASDLETLSLADKARAECDLLNELNDFYLELLHADSDEPVVGRPMVDVEKLVDEIVADFPGKFNATARVRVQTAGRMEPMCVNKSALRLIVMNLLENALLYSQVSTPVVVELERTPDKRGMVDRDLLKLRVIDHGIGIPEPYLRKIFSPFVRLREDIAVGSGLGLTLVKSLVELHGGEVFIRGGTGRGTAVHVTIPAADPRETDPLVTW